MTVPIRILCLIIGLLIAGPLSVPGWASVRSENRVWEIFPTSSQSAPAEHAQPIELHQENPGCGYDFAPAVHKYLYASANPINNVDPSGHATEGLGGQLITHTGISGLASQSIAAVGRGMVSAYVRLPQLIDGAGRALYWLEAGGAVLGAGLTIAPEVLEAAANVADSFDRLAVGIRGSFSAGPVVRGVQMEEGIFRQVMEESGGKYYGGTVKGIDGEIAVTPGGILVQGKSHDVAPDRLLDTIARGVEKFSTVDGEEIYGKKSPSVGGGTYSRPPSAAGGKIYLVAVPESQARLIGSSEFGVRLRELAQRTRTIPSVRAVRNFKGVPR